MSRSEVAVHPWYLSEIAFETSRERQRMGERLARLQPVAPPQHASPARRWLARVAAALSRASASIAVRLDEHVALPEARRSPST